MGLLERDLIITLNKNVKAQIPNRERGSGGDRNSLGVEANGQGSSNW